MAIDLVIITHAELRRVSPTRLQALLPAGNSACIAPGSVAELLDVSAVATTAIGPASRGRRLPLEPEFSVSTRLA
jgi:hypothetical protein